MTKDKLFFNLSKTTRLNALVNRRLMHRFKKIIKLQGYLVPKGVENALQEYCDKHKEVLPDNKP